MRCQLTWNWAGYIAPTLCSRSRSTRLWSLLHSYGRLQRWNVRPVNTEGRKNHPIWHEHYKHTMNTPKCEITKHRRHQVLCNVEKKKGALNKNYVWWCMQNEGKSPLAWMQWLCNICMHTVKQCIVYMNQNDHASVTLLAVLVANEKCIETSGYITPHRHNVTHFELNCSSGLQTGVTLTS